MTEISIDVGQESELWGDLAVFDALAQKAIGMAARMAGVALMDGAELSVMLSDDARVREVNRAWRKMDKPTNVLSFPAAEADKISSSPFLGDVILAFETVEREAADEDKPFADHVAHLMVHGFLHLIGYDHETDQEAERMEALETRALAELGIADPYRV